MGKKDSPKGKAGGPAGCTAVQCPHTGNGHCSNAICGNNWINCPIHGNLS